MPAPTTAELEEPPVRLAHRVTDRLAAAADEDGHGYLDPDLAVLRGAIF